MQSTGLVIMPEKGGKLIFCSMEKYLVRSEPSAVNPKQCVLRTRWKRSLTELNGRFEPKCRHDLSDLLIQSYHEVGQFPHLYHLHERPCPTHMNRLGDGLYFENEHIIRKPGISALDFDSKGIYLASVTRSGCLTVHDFETLYCLRKGTLPCFKEDENKHLLHLCVDQQLDVVRWNLANQDEVACASKRSNEVHIFDIGYISSEPVEVLRTRPSITVLGYDAHKGLSDIAFTATDESRLFGSDTHGVINVWDRRTSSLPCIELITGSRTSLSTIKVHAENQIIFGGAKNGCIYIWDLRGGKNSAAFQSYKEVCLPPLTSVRIASMLQKIGSLKVQSYIVPQEIQSIHIDPSCPYQLAFHLDNGWSGVLDIYNLQVTHVHCPPPACLTSSDSTYLLRVRTLSWLPTNSICAVGSSSDSGIHLLDFYPDSSSPCHVDYIEDEESLSGEKNRKQNRFVPLSEGVTACASHPLNGTIIAGTQLSSLLMVSQHQHCTSHFES